ncbi:hypothetical protein E2F48_11530 [Arthrobacter crusticola]|uniref:Transmembrane protein n=1 Tax=Arthrobacter crusticola TaxID=2547960 RepID=A0A4R5TXC6_9MICC|nr:hypothetical protein E2F48_11530 [Arthrobacter crusticola]
METNDTSGRGGPFKSCTTESVECTSPNWAMALILVTIMLALCLAAGREGFRRGRCRPGRYLLSMLTALSAVLGVGMNVWFWAALII